MVIVGRKWVWVAGIGALLFGQAFAADYTIRDIPVSATAEDASTARMLAMGQAEEAAFTKLLEQSLPADQAAARRAAIPAGNISSLVTGYDVRNEKISARSYSAVIDVTFSASGVSALLNQAAPGQAYGQPSTGAAYGGVISGGAVASGTSYVLKQPVTAGQYAAPVTGQENNPVALVLPVYEISGRKLLWEENNIWRAVWNATERSDAQLLRLPIGDQSDRLVLPEAAQAGSFSQVNTLAQRYQAGTVVLAVASQTVSSAGVKAVQVTLSSLGAGHQSQESPRIYQFQPGEDVNAAMARAAQDIAYQLTDELYRQQQAGRAAPAAADAAGTGQALPVAVTPSGQITVLSRLTAAADWVRLRKRLMEVPNVAQVQLSAISNQQADVIVYFKGSLGELEADMVASGMQVSKTPRYWVITF